MAIKITRNADGVKFAKSRAPWIIAAAVVIAAGAAWGGTAVVANVQAEQEQAQVQEQQKADAVREAAEAKAEAQAAQAAAEAKATADAAAAAQAKSVADAAAAQAAADAAAQDATKNRQSTSGGGKLAAGRPVTMRTDPAGNPYPDTTSCASGSASTVNGVPTCD